MTRILLALFMLLLFAGISFTAMYKWVDEEGNVHYGDYLPAERKSEQLETPPAPSKEDIQRSREREELLIQKQKQTEKTRKLESETKRRQDEQRKIALEKKCKVLRSRFFLLGQSGVITFTDDEGNLMRPTAQQRLALMKDIKTFLQKNCK